MKAIFTFGVCVLALPVCTQAQFLRQAGKQKHPADRFTAAILQQQMTAGTAAKTTAQTQRIIAQTNISAAGIDSTTYVWKSFKRGAAHNPKNIDSYFDSYDPYADGEPEAQTARIQYIFADSIISYESGVATSSRGLLYNTAGKPVRISDYDSGQVVSIVQLGYNSSGNNVSVLSLSPALNVEQRQASVFNAAGKAVADTIEQLQFNYKRILISSYNASNQLISVLRLFSNSLGGYDSSRSVYTYNTAGLLSTARNEFYVNGAWKANSKDSINYSGTNPAYTSRYYFSADSNGNLSASYREMNTLNSAGNWSTLVYQFYTGVTWFDDTKIAFTYNSFNNYQLAQIFQAQNGIFPAVPTSIARFYYQTYDPASVSEMEAAIAGIVVVPNPANGNFQIRRSNAAAADYILTDVTGRVATFGQIQETVETVSVQNLPAGVYFLTVRTSQARPVTQQVIIR